MAKQVKVKLELLESAAAVYDEQITVLRDAHRQAVDAIERLRNSNWISTGADFFFQNYDDGWKKDLENHISYLEHLRDCLKLAHEGFTEEYNKKNLF